MGKGINETHQKWSTYTNNDLLQVQIGTTVYGYDKGLKGRLQQHGLCLYPADMIDMEENIKEFIQYNIPQSVKLSPIMHVLYRLSPILECNLGVGQQ